jgi:signal transduction histidine kinase
MNTVLIVSDSPTDRTRLRALLEPAGLKVHDAVPGRNALDQARAVRPHLILLATTPPTTDGFEACRALKSSPDTRELPILMLTARVPDESLAALEAGADDSAERDAPPAVLLARIRRLVEFCRLARLALLNEHLVQVGRLLAGVVHEIRGPLSVIRGSADLLQMQYRDAVECAQWIEPIVRNSRLLQKRLEHLMAAVRHGSTESQAVDPAPIVEESVDMFIKGSDPRGAKIKVELLRDAALPRVRVDAGRIIQVLLSLLGNAHEALLGLGAEHRIQVHASTARRDDAEWVIVEVADDGAGIPEPFLERIFEPYFTTKEHGTGYGLYMAREMIREQHGCLTVRNAPSGGAVFTIWLPAVSVDAPCPS